MICASPKPTVGNSHNMHNILIPRRCAGITERQRSGLGLSSSRDWPRSGRRSLPFERAQKDCGRSGDGLRGAERFPMLPDRFRGLPIPVQAAHGAIDSGSAQIARSPMLDDEAEAKRQIGAILDQADRELAAGVGYELSEVQRRMQLSISDRL